MVKITFEFESVEEAYRFLKTVDYDLNASIALPKAIVAEAYKLNDGAVDEIKPLSARERRLANKGTSKAKTKKTRGKSLKKKEAPISDEITDADLARAASNGAEEIGPKLVTEILEQFGVGNVSELKGSQRKEFIELLNSETK